MRSDFEDTFALQRLYEKWVVKEEWLVNEEAIPLLLGTDPTTDFLTSEYKQLQNRIQTAISEGDIKTVTGSTETSDHIKVQPAIIYQWAMTNRLTLPMELINLMEFVLKTVLLNEPEPDSQNESGLLSENNDAQQLLGACFAIAASFPEECKNSRGVVKTERVLRLLDEHSDRLFDGQLPALSSTVIRDLVNHWVQKLK
ncbi:MAG: hypothetical protein HN764_04875 [Gammaproteobacteria bacterium]|nr:hypothetical protein [Gammaproteobacteria bacterium]